MIVTFPEIPTIDGRFVKNLAICRHSMPRPLGFAVRAWNKLVTILYGSLEDDEALDGNAQVRTGRAGVTAA